MLASMADLLSLHSALFDADRIALNNLAKIERSFEPGSFIIREGDHPTELLVLTSGLCIIHKISTDGYRQIVSIKLSEDIININNIYLDISDYNVQSLTRCTVVAVPKNEMRSLATQRVALGTALIRASLIEASIYREWILNNGRRDARTRIGHLLCELAVRLDVSGTASGQAYDLPMSQEQLGDAVSITPVHVNRSLKSLVHDGLIEQSGRRIVFPDWNRLKDEAGFNERYLHGRQRS